MKRLENIPRNRKPTKEEYRDIVLYARTDGKYGLLLYLLCRCLQTKKPMWRTWMNLLNQTIDRINSLEVIEPHPADRPNVIEYSTGNGTYEIHTTFSVDHSQYDDRPSG